VSDLLDVRGAAAYLGVTEAFIRRIVVERRVRYYKVGKFVRFRASDLDAMIEAGCVEPTSESSARLVRREPTHRRTRRTGSVS
jgi:excisionase family DNA binding protein